MTGALAKVAALKPVTYKWNIDDSESQGFIAHELQEVVPDCVTGEKDAVDAEGNPQYQGIDTSFLVATLTAAIQELNAKVDAQAAEIAALKGQA
jgi:squalene cyclase